MSGLPACGPNEKIKSEPIVGVKIYDVPGNMDQLFRAWASLGVNTALVSGTLLANADFRAAAKKNGVAVFVIFPTFQDPEELAKQPELAAITARGEPAREDWVQFVCPTKKEFRNRRIAQVKDWVGKYDPDGLSLDFIRFFVFWEMVYPERTPDSLPQTCFCPTCLEDFQKTENIKLPENLSGTAEASGWILKNHPAEWTDWKCRVITNMVKDLVAAAKAVKPDIKINVHTVPWRKGDFGGAIEAVAGQDIARIAGFVDYFSPMCYHHMVGRNPDWIHDVVQDVFDRGGRDVLPSIQVDKAYVEK
ncbi:MAG: glycoside hydrolase family 10 protein, partial [Candidatus Aminicenantales bacterium]